MELSSWVDQERGRQSELATSLDVPPQLVWGWAKGGRPIPDDRRPAIEAATKGDVPCEEMGDDVIWHRVADKNWPWHPKGRPLKDVVRTAERRAELEPRAA